MVALAFLIVLCRLLSSQARDETRGEHYRKTAPKGYELGEGDPQYYGCRVEGCKSKPVRTAKEAAYEKNPDTCQLHYEPMDVKMTKAVTS
jgi:hypothetical protein